MNFFNFISNIIFPPQCLVCGKNIENGVICEVCFREIPLFETLQCGICGARLPDRKKTCHPDIPYLLAAATSYDVSAVKTLIHKLKFRSMRKAAEPLGDLLFCYLTKLDLDLRTFSLVPVPLSRKRKYERGFNQAEEIARRIIQRTENHLTLLGTVLVRIKNTKPQTETATRHERLVNIQNCFAVRDPASIHGKNILLLDDVTTSGATLREAALALKAVGAKKIIALVVAKA